jgi:cell wall-associated NlpC family hydrolase
MRGLAVAGAAFTVGAVVVPIALLTVLGGGNAAALGADGQSCTVAFTSASAARQTSSWKLDADQVQNARTTIAIVKARSLPDAASVITLITELQESDAHNLDHGDRDSVGVLQQRPSQGWGTKEQIMVPAYAIGKFLDRMVQVPGWQTLDPNAVAQTVQISATPEAYGAHLPEATAIIAALAGDTGVKATCTSRAPVGKGVATVLARAKTGLGLPYCWAGGTPTGPTPGSATTGPDPGPGGLSPGCDAAHPGYDCSGLAQFAFAGVGIQLPHLASAQYTAAGGVQVPLSQIQPGDLVFYSSDATVPGIHHVAIVYASGQIIEAQQDGVPVHIRPWTASESELMPNAIRLPAGGSR